MANNKQLLQCIETELNTLDTLNANINKLPEVLKKGFRGMFSYGRLVDEDGNAYSLDIINTYQFNPYYMLGIGVGARLYSDHDCSRLPVYLYNRLRFSSSDMAPFISFGFGYNYNVWDDLDRTGLFLQLGLGYSVKISHKLAINLGISYENYKTNIDSSWPGQQDSRFSTRGLGFSLGLIF